MKILFNKRYIITVKNYLTTSDDVTLKPAQV